MLGLTSMEAVDIKGSYGMGGQSFVVLDMSGGAGPDVLRRADCGWV